MPARSPALLLLAASLLAACDAAEPPPGELIGSFRFVATLDSAPAPGRCTFAGAPQQISFEGVLSHDPLDDRLWISSGRSRREGTLEEAHFEVRAPASGPGILRTLSVCSCSFRMVEVLEGDLLTSKECGPGRALPSLEPARGCPQIDGDGKLDWSECGCIRGRIREEVEFLPPADEEELFCTCEVGESIEAAPERCEFVYSLEGSLL